MDINTVTIKGRLTMNPELVTKPNKTKYIHATIATSHLIGVDEWKNCYISIVAFGKVAEYIERGSKGDTIIVHGFVNNNSYMAGNKRCFQQQVVANEAAYNDEPNSFTKKASNPKKPKKADMDIPVDNDLPY